MFFENYTGSNYKPMKQFYIEITFEHPYPQKTNYTELATDFAVATKRAIRKWRKEHKGIKINKLILSVVKL